MADLLERFGAVEVQREQARQHTGQELRKVEEADWETADQLAAAERTLCGLTHPELGSEACQRWGLPRLISEVVRLHHSKWNPAPQTPLERLVCVVQVADACMFSSVSGGVHGARASVAELAQRIAPKLPPGLPLTADALGTLMQSSEREAQVLLDALGL